MRVGKRQVIYVQGYDPRGLAQYYRMFRTELRKFAELYHVDAEIGRPRNAADGKSASWTIDTKSNDWQVTTTYDFLRWEDLIKQDLAEPIWRQVIDGFATYVRLITHGVLQRFWRAHWRFALFMTYPPLMLAVEALSSILVGIVGYAGWYAAGLPAPVGVILAAAAALAVFAALVKYTEKRTYLLYLITDSFFTFEFAHGRRPAWDDRIDQFANKLVSQVQASDADEVLIVGHSSGSFLSIEILAKALQIDPDLGRRGPQLILLTVGANLPVVGFHKAARGFRERLRLVAAEASIDWIDCQSRKDVMNFYPFDHVAGHDIDLGLQRRNPTIVPLRFRDAILPENYDRFRWQFFRVHFQFVMANERPQPYDFFMITCGPVSLQARMANPAAALEIAIGNAADRHAAWEQLGLPVKREAYRA